MQKIIDIHYVPANMQHFERYFLLDLIKLFLLD